MRLRGASSGWCPHACGVRVYPNACEPLFPTLVTRMCSTCVQSNLCGCVGASTGYCTHMSQHLSAGRLHARTCVQMPKSLGLRMRCAASAQGWLQHIPHTGRIGASLPCGLRRFFGHPFFLCGLRRLFLAPFFADIRRQPFLSLSCAASFEDLKTWALHGSHPCLCSTTPVYATAVRAPPPHTIHAVVCLQQAPIHKHHLTLFAMCATACHPCWCPQLPARGTPRECRTQAPGPLQPNTMGLRAPSVHGSHVLVQPAPCCFFLRIPARRAPAGTLNKAQMRTLKKTPSCPSCQPQLPLPLSHTSRPAKGFLTGRSSYRCRSHHTQGSSRSGR